MVYRPMTATMFQSVLNLDYPSFQRMRIRLLARALELGALALICITSVGLIGGWVF